MTLGYWISFLKPLFIDNLSLLPIYYSIYYIYYVIYWIFYTVIPIPDIKLRTVRRSLYFIALVKKNDDIEFDFNIFLDEFIQGDWR